MTLGNIMHVSGDQHIVTPLQVAIEDIKALREQVRALTARVEWLEKEVGRVKE